MLSSSMAMRSAESTQLSRVGTHLLRLPCDDTLPRRPSPVRHPPPILARDPQVIIDMDPELLIERVQRWSGIPRKREAERAILATLRALRQAMFDDEAAALAEELPQRFLPSMRAGGMKAVVDTEQLYRSAARSEGVPMRIALEHVQAVCQALASLLPEGTLARLLRALPQFAGLFAVPDRTPEAVVTTHSSPSGTLAEGRPGSEHPLSEATPYSPPR